MAHLKYKKYHKMTEKMTKNRPINHKIAKFDFIKKTRFFLLIAPKCLYMPLYGWCLPLNCLSL